MARMLPEKDTPEYEVWLCAIDVVHAAPLTHGPTTFAASVPWATIEKLRAALEAVGIDWKSVHPKTKQKGGR